MTAPVLVTGGTGTLGRHVTAQLAATGRAVRVLSRHAHDPSPGVEYAVGDLLTGDRVDAAVDGTEVVVHLAGAARGDDVVARNLTRAATRAGVRHLVFVSVVAADRVPIGYYRRKVAAERIIADSGIPWTTLRAAQFHDLVFWIARKLATLPVLPTPSGVRMQPVDSRDVAARLVELAHGTPSGMVADLAGPGVYPLAELVRDYLHVAGKRRPLLPVHLPGRIGRVYRAGANLNLDATTGERTWSAFLAEQQPALPRG